VFITDVKQLIVESPITRIFTGNLRSILRKPGHKDSITLEPYRPLQLDIQDRHVRSVTDALKHITATETITPDFDDTGRAMTRRSFIEKLPPILILHLKRFVYDKNGTKKVWKKIAYPLNLEIPLEVLSPTQRSESPTQFQLFGGTRIKCSLVDLSYISSWNFGNRGTLYS
jgi:ubiquitin carboxyl-terminal hydrolase 10